MALYHDPTKLTKVAGGAEAFDVIFKPGETPAYSGIYKCQQCGVEVVAEQARKLPPTSVCSQHHPAGTQKVGKVTRKMIVYAEHEGD